MYTSGFENSTGPKMHLSYRAQLFTPVVPCGNAEKMMRWEAAPNNQEAVYIYNINGVYQGYLRYVVSTKIG